VHAVYRHSAVYRHMAVYSAAMGKKTSIYLSDELAEAVKASGVRPAELIRRGLDVREPMPPEIETMREALPLFRRTVAWLEYLAGRD